MASSLISVAPSDREFEFYSRPVVVIVDDTNLNVINYNHGGIKFTFKICLA